MPTPTDEAFEARIAALLQSREVPATLAVGGHSGSWLRRSGVFAAAGSVLAVAAAAVVIVANTVQHHLPGVPATKPPVAVSLTPTSPGPKNQRGGSFHRKDREALNQQRPAHKPTHHTPAR